MFPALNEIEFGELTEDIRKRGLLNPIHLYEGKILDGWHRYRACLSANVEPRFVDFKVNGVGPVEFVVSQNIMRRQMTMGQKLAVAVRLIESVRAGRGKMPNGQGHLAVDLAKKLHISDQAVDRAYVVYRKDPALFNSIRDGKRSVTSAYKQLKGMIVSASPDAKQWTPPKKLYTEWDAWVLMKTMTSEMGWQVAIQGKAGEWKVQFYEKEPQPFDAITAWTSIKAAMQYAAAQVYAK